MATAHFSLKLRQATTPVRLLLQTVTILLFLSSLAISQITDIQLHKWNVHVKPGSELAKIKQRYERRSAIGVFAFASNELSDPSPIPSWFRAYLRDTMELPEVGKYQYPRAALQALEWMVAHQDLRVQDVTNFKSEPANITATPVTGNISLSALTQISSESAIAVDYNSGQYLIAASNTMDGRQKQFYSSDGGATWRRTDLPLGAGVGRHSDPSVAFMTDGTAWTSTLGISKLGNYISVQLYKSQDHGAIWQYVTTVSSGPSNDKEMLWIDNFPSSPHKDNIYVVWDYNAKKDQGVRFAMSSDRGATWQPAKTLSTDAAIGTHLMTGPTGELYVAWPDTNSQELRIRRSDDGGLTFGPVSVIAKTQASYEISVPAMCQRQVLIYLTLTVDRTQGARKGAVYATWTDKTSADQDPGCDGLSSHVTSRVFFSSSTDGGLTWAKPQMINPTSTHSDQFNQWMDIDPKSGAIYLTYYDSQNDSNRRKVDLYYISSTDGGTIWSTPTKVTTAQSDESDDKADLNQYGDYNGLVVYQNLIHPVWTDRRSAANNSKEQIFTLGSATSRADAAKKAHLNRKQPH